MFLGLRGKNAIVCAASKGLGLAVAHELAVEGATVVICARGEAALKAARDKIAKETGATVYAMVSDLSQYDDVKRLASGAIKKLGHVDILVNNAGGPPAGPLEKNDSNNWQAGAGAPLRH